MWVLQIDDDRDDLEIFGAALRLFDSNVNYSGVTTIEEAFDLINANSIATPETIFLDINMPRYSGFDCYAIFKNDSRFNLTRFVFLSTTINPKDLPLGADFVQKQHSLKTYVKLLKELLRPPSGVVPHKNSFSVDFSLNHYKVQFS